MGWYFKIAEMLAPGHSYPPLASPSKAKSISVWYIQKCLKAAILLKAAFRGFIDIFSGACLVTHYFLLILNEMGMLSKLSYRQLRVFTYISLYFFYRVIFMLCLCGRLPFDGWAIPHSFSANTSKQFITQYYFFGMHFCRFDCLFMALAWAALIFSSAFRWLRYIIFRGITEKYTLLICDRIRLFEAGWGQLLVWDTHMPLHAPRSWPLAWVLYFSTTPPAADGIWADISLCWVPLDEWLAATIVDRSPPPLKWPMIIYWRAWFSSASSRALSASCILYSFCCIS